MSKNNKMDVKERLIQVAKTLLPCDLPIGVYLVTRGGEFVQCNPRAREILNLPQNASDINANINDFYCDRHERTRLMEELEKAEARGKFLEKKVITFNVNKQKIWVQDYCRSVKAPDTGEVIGYTGCLVDVTEEESFRQLFDKLPVGVYKLDADNRISHANKAFADILGYENTSELKGIHIKDLYVDPDEADEFEQKIMEEGSVMNERVELFKKTNERCYLSVFAYIKLDKNDKTYIGREGTIQDVTDEENYRQIRDKIPVGTYMVKKNEKGKEVIHQCNKALADMFEYEIGEIRGKEVKELYATEKDYEDFINDITQKHKQNEITEGIPIKVKTSKGRLFDLEVHCRLLTDKNNNILGRVGIVLDISNKIALRELRDDIGKILHFYSAALVTLDQSIKPILRVLGPDPFESREELTIEKAVASLTEPTEKLKNVLIKLLEVKNESQYRQRALSGRDWSTLEKQMQLLEKYREIIPHPEFHVDTLRVSSNIILGIYSRIEKGTLSRELKRDLLNKAKELERICCLIKTHQALDTILEVDYTIRALREYVIFQQRQPDPPIIIKISSLIQNAVYQLYSFAMHRRVEIKQDYQSCNATVKVKDRSIIRALSNLLYNAIKYSWYRELGRKPWVTVKAYTGIDSVYVEFQNYGVPIAKDEIENELIFRIGYRGKYSGDRRRMGTGVGLSDARETARKHGGDLIIKSIPASDPNDWDYHKPFLTTATLKLPLHE